MIGRAVSAGLQYGITGDVDWRVVGGSAVAGAIIGFTGAVGRLANVIRGWWS